MAVYETIEIHRHTLRHTLQSLLPCCAEQACVRSGSDHSPVLHTGAHHQLQCTHLERERESERDSFNITFSVTLCV